jgi:hypothetical protein
MKLPRVTVAAMGAFALALAVPSSAPASPVVSDPIVSGLVGPLQIDLGHRGTIYVAQAFSGTLTKVARNGTTTDLTTDPTGVDGVASGGRGVAYTSTDFAPATRAARLKLRAWNGTIKTVADVWPYEVKNNPDASNTYGFLDLNAKCAAEVDALPPPPEDEGPPLSGSPYRGAEDSHPYALANDGSGGWYVADAGMNAVLRVSGRGAISTVAVLPPQPAKVTAAGAKALGVPACTVGSTYAFEPVPTDVEVARRGKLIVSTLPGGPENGSMGARGAVYEISVGGGHHRGQPGASHTVRQLAGGFLGATNVAIGRRGEIYVAELFGNKVSVLRQGGVSTVAKLPAPAGVEYRDGKVYVSYDVFPPQQGPPDGKIATIRVGHRHH